MRANVKISPWAQRAMNEDALKVARRLSLVIVATTPQGPWWVRHPALTAAIRGRDVNALVLQAAKELTDAG